MSPHEQSALDIGIRFTYEPIQVIVHIYFKDDGTLRAHYNVNSKGEISTVRPAGAGAHHANSAKGIGKGYVAA